MVGRFHREHPHNEVVSYFLTEIGILYGIYAGHDRRRNLAKLRRYESKVTAESAALAALYRDVSNYPIPREPPSERDAGIYSLHDRSSVAAATPRNHSRGL